MKNQEQVVAYIQTIRTGFETLFEAQMDTSMLLDLASKRLQQSMADWLEFRMKDLTPAEAVMAVKYLLAQRELELGNKEGVYTGGQKTSNTLTLTEEVSGPVSGGMLVQRDSPTDGTAPGVSNKVLSPSFKGGKRRDSKRLAESPGQIRT